MYDPDSQSEIRMSIRLAMARAGFVKVSELAAAARLEPNALGRKLGAKPSRRITWKDLHKIASATGHTYRQTLEVQPRSKGYCKTCGGGGLAPAGGVDGAKCLVCRGTGEAGPTAREGWKITGDPADER